MKAGAGERERIAAVFGELLNATGRFLSGIRDDERTDEHQRMFAAHAAASKLLWGPNGVAEPISLASPTRKASVHGGGTE